MNIYELKRKQVINTTLEEAWEFFSTPKNLDLLTPENMGFKILNKESLGKMFKGQRIRYKVSPLLNIPLSWETLITDVKDYEYFTDLQLKGPYKLWRHTHYFKAVENGVEMTDELQYAMPFGFLGQIMHNLYVKDRLEEIFTYRYDKVEQIFNQKDSDIAEKLSAAKEAPPISPPSTSALAKSS